MFAADTDESLFGLKIRNYKSSAFARELLVVPLLHAVLHKRLCHLEFQRRKKIIFLRTHVMARLSVSGNGTVLPDMLVGIFSFEPAETQLRFNKERFYSIIYLQVAHAVRARARARARVCVCVCVYTYNSRSVIVRCNGASAPMYSCAVSIPSEKCDIYSVSMRVHLRIRARYLLQERSAIFTVHRCECT